MTVASIAVAEALLVLKIAVPRPALPVHLEDRALGRPRRAHAAGELRARAGIGAAAWSASSRSSRPAGSSWSRARRWRRATSCELDSSALLIGRGSRNDVDLGRDEFASSEHARVEPRRDGVWLEDVGSTNGTYRERDPARPAPKRLTAGRRRPGRRDRTAVRAHEAGRTSRVPTDTGRKRRHNEDAFVFEPPLFAVADGMGGAQAGELASSLAAAALRGLAASPAAAARSASTS